MTGPPLHISVAQVHAVRVPAQSPSGIAAFAIDSPRAPAESYGSGVEINGWVIGREASVHGVRTVAGNRTSRLYPLDVLRPDVAAAHPQFGYAGTSGFSAWLPLPGDVGDSRLELAAVLSTGEHVVLAEILATVAVEERRAGPGGALPVSAPDFVIIGAQRGGTTSLHAYLSAHPQVVTPATKELHFLTDRFERGLDWYLGHFPSSVPNGTVTGEATPYALFHPLAPARLRLIAPGAKLIALLRNPVDRAYSHYLLERALGFETLDFASALDAEVDRLAGEEERFVGDPAYVSDAHKHASYLARGDYVPQLERWFAHFPREQMLVLRSEDLYERPAETTAQAAAFLGIAPVIDIPFAAHNRSAGPPLAPALRSRVHTHFAPKIARLEQLVGWSTGWA